MTTSRLARRLGLDGNPLRRRSDNIAAGLAALLVAMFLVGAPWLSVAAASWAGRTGAIGHRAERSWRQVPAVLQRAAPVPATWELLDRSWVQARRPTPGGQARAGETVVGGGLAADHAVPLRVDAHGRRAPPSHARPVLAREAAAAVMAAAALGAVLLCLGWAGRWVLDRRRLAGWEAAWAAVGPRWTRRFWSRG